MTPGAIKILRIEVDGHFHGSSDVPRPWVARIAGVDARYGLDREFVDALRDYAGSKRSWAGRLNGVVACFPLRDGNLYEVCRLRGRPSKRHVAREFISVEDGKAIEIEALEALARVEAHAGATIGHAVPDGTRISRVDGLGTPSACGFVIVDGERIHRLRVGAIHEIETNGRRHLIVVGDHGVDRISQADALSHLLASTSSTTEAS